MISVGCNVGWTTCLFTFFFTQEGTPNILRLSLIGTHTVIIPAASQETVEEAGNEPGTAVLQSGSPSCLKQLSHHIPTTEPPHPHN
jgi:hypothetical protein